MAALAGDAVRAGATGFSDLAHPEPPHLDRRLHADAESRRGRTDRDRRRHAWRRPQHVPVRARSVHHINEEDLPMMLQVGREYQNPGFCSRSPRERYEAPQKALARQTLDIIGDALEALPACRSPHRSPRRPRRVDARAGTCRATRSRPIRATKTAIAHLPLAERLKRLHQPRSARRDPERARHRDRRSAVLPAELRQDPYLLGNPPDYEQPPENTLGAAQACAARASSRKHLAYDAMLTDERPRHAVPCRSTQLCRRQSPRAPRARCCAIRIRYRG